MTKTSFGSLWGDVTAPFRVVLIDPQTDLTLEDSAGNEAFIEVLSAQSEVGRKFDKEQRAQFQRRAMRGRNQQIIEDDQLEQNIAKLARLTVAWHLVDPLTKEALDVPLSVETATEFYSLPLAHSFYLQAFLGANEAANFIKGSPKI
ncbi:MAG: hypothetical protein WDN48_06055 [Pseudolabrys sp.]